MCVIRTPRHIFPLGNLHLDCRLCGAAHIRRPARAMQQADCKRCQQQINDNHQDELISSTTVKQPTDAIDYPPPLFSSAGEERGGVGVCPGLINEQEKILKPYLSFL